MWRDLSTLQRGSEGTLWRKVLFSAWSECAMAIFEQAPRLARCAMKFDYNSRDRESEIPGCSANTLSNLLAGRIEEL
jgi:hypothetical protein